MGAAFPALACVELAPETPAHQPSSGLLFKRHNWPTFQPALTPRTSSVGGTIVFTGTLHGAQLPPGGKQLVLEASSGGEWIQFRTIATDAKGRYRASYRFKFPGPIVYRFRVYAPHEADFPFLAGTSNVVSVYER
jgi:hypothetical protein